MYVNTQCNAFTVRQSRNMERAEKNRSSHIRQASLNTCFEY